MWFVISKKKHQEFMKAWGHRVDGLNHKVAEQQGNIAAKDTLLKSTEREKVLLDLQDALNMVIDYQRTLSAGSFADPQIIRANTLLAKYGMEGDPNASYLGFQRHKGFKEPLPNQDDIVDLDAAIIKRPPKEETLQEYIAREEEAWGDEAYGSGTVKIEAEAIDEGENKEDGFTRAHVAFYEGDEEEPEFVWDGTPHE